MMRIIAGLCRASVRQRDRGSMKRVIGVRFQAFGGGRARYGVARSMAMCCRVTVIKITQQDRKREAEHEPLILQTIA